MARIQIPSATAADIPSCVSRALQEDIGTGDITAQLIPRKKIITAAINVRQSAVVCGIPWAEEVFHQLDGNVAIKWHFEEGDETQAGETLATLSGNARALVSGERTALNFLQTLSSTATHARQYSLHAEGKGPRILDTRKTVPGLRKAQKYAVRVGGCYNHRMGLYDAFLIKENHIHACGGIEEAIKKARDIASDKLVEVEVENIEQLTEALTGGADVILLDNFSIQDMQVLNKIDLGNTKLEISGNITITMLDKYKNLPIDFLSSGDLTKNIVAIDLSMRFIQ